MGLLIKQKANSINSFTNMYFLFITKCNNDNSNLKHVLQLYRALTM